MKCTEIYTYIDNLLDDELTQGEKAIFEDHVSKCTECANKLAEAKDLQSALQGLQVPEPSADFESRMFAEVRRQHSTHQSDRFVAGFATAIAASLLIWVAAAVFFPGVQVGKPEVISVAFNETQTVRLMFDSQKPIQVVTLSLDLPSNIELDGYPGQQQLIWQTSLKQGANVLALPVMAVGHGQGELVAQLQYGDVMKTFRVVLKTSDDGVQSYQLDEFKSA